MHDNLMYGTTHWRDYLKKTTLTWALAMISSSHSDVTQVKNAVAMSVGMAAK